MANILERVRRIVAVQFALDEIEVNPEYPDTILRCVRVVVSQKCSSTAPREYLKEHVSNTVTNIILGYAHYPHAQAGKQ